MKNKWSKIGNLYLGSLAVAVILCGSPQRAEAAVLAEYLFNGSTGASTDGDVDSTAGAFGPSVFLSTSFTDPNFNGTDTVAIRTPTSSMVSSQNPSFNFNFTITPTAGNRLMLGGNAALTFEYARNAGWAGANEFHWAVRSSLDSFGSDVATGATAGGATWNSASVTLPAAFDFQDAPVTFRFEVWDDTQNVTTDFGYFDNVVLNGTVVPVPEPVNVALGVFGLCVAGVGVARRFYLRTHA